MIARLRKGAVINLFLVAGIGLSVYYATTLTERGAAGLGLRRQHGVRTPPGHPRSLNVATLTERETTTLLVVPTGATNEPARVVSRSVNVAYRRHSYPVDFRHRWLLEKAHRIRTNTKLSAEHAHVQRLLRELRHVRTVQAHAEKGGRPDAVAVGTNSPGITASSLSVWRARQIAAAETIGREADAAGTDPWPQCPDPYDHTGASWDDTVACENSGDWMDSPGFYRCGLQFDPMWERRFGALCP